jgi:hypothetical protein
MRYRELSATAQTAYAQLQDVALAQNISRSVARLRGSFALKTVKGRGYWYFAFREGSRVHQIYVGPDEPRVRKLVDAKQSAADDDGVAPLALAYAAQGGTTLLPKHLRVITRLADFGFFRVGGVLVGTHAFAGYANMLGLRWASSDMTMDVDLAVPGKHISIALPDAPPVDLHDALTSFEAGFIPLQSPEGRAGPTYLLKGDRDFQIDFLTTRGRGGDRPRTISALSVTAQPLKFLEYLLEAPTQTVLLDRLGHHCVASVPAPARYAVHKLIVHGERDIRYRTKARKDLEQAAALIDWLRQHDRESLRNAWDDAFARGPGWRRRLNAGVQALRSRWPDDGLDALFSG